MNHWEAMKLQMELIVADKTAVLYRLPHCLLLCHLLSFAWDKGARKVDVIGIVVSLVILPWSQVIQSVDHLRSPSSGSIAKASGLM